MNNMTRLEVRVHQMRHEADGIVSVELRPLAAGEELPAFDAGAHVDLHLSPGLVRSYSLMNDPAERHRYLLGVLRDRASRGGSRHVHEQLRVGSTIAISAPRNHFRLNEESARSVLLAGGIGVTPLLAMLRRLVALGREVDFIYCVRNRAQAAFVDEIAAHVSLRVRFTLRCDEEAGSPPDLAAMLGGFSRDTHFYACGPAPMLDSFERTCAALGHANAHIERFAAAPPAPDAASAEGFTVELRKSGRVISVPASQSILQAVLDAGVDTDYSCQDGICGACETRVISGEVDHRDSILTDEERAQSKSMMICVSRCKGASLVLDL